MSTRAKKMEYLLDQIDTVLKLKAEAFFEEFPQIPYYSFPPSRIKIPHCPNIGPTLEKYRDIQPE